MGDWAGEYKIHLLSQIAFWLAVFELWLWVRKSIMECGIDEGPLAKLDGHEHTEIDRVRSLFASYVRPADPKAEPKA